MINTGHGYGFLKFFREHRIDDAKQQLLTDAWTVSHSHRMNQGAHQALWFT